MTDDVNHHGPFDRLSSGARLVAVCTTAVLSVFSLGGVAGFSKAWSERGGVPSAQGLLALTGFILATLLFGWLSWRLSSHWRAPGRSGYERRYTRMWVILIALGFPAGLLLGFANDPAGGVGSLVGTGPIEPVLAVVTAAAISALMVISMVLYHRTVDDHEQQAYLWANSIAYYFLLIALPAAWLLARGGLIPAIGIGTVMLTLLGAVIINCAVWLWLKYR